MDSEESVQVWWEQTVFFVTGECLSPLFIVSSFEGRGVELRVTGPGSYLCKEVH